MVFGAYYLLKIQYGGGKGKIVFAFEMKKYFKLLIKILVTFCAIICHTVCARCEDISVSAKSAILMCAGSGSTLWSKNECEPLPMASTTKIMTALLVLEAISACGNKEIEITDEMVRIEGTSMGLMPGDIVTMEALAQGMLLCSGNDAANAGAIAVSGNTDKFLTLMNQKSKAIGMQNTLFSTPSGLDKDHHHSTARDMAVLGAYAMENENFAKIVSQKSMKVNFVNPGKSVNLRNHNKLLRLYDGCVGIKTGFTKAAGRCLVSCAEKEGVRLVAVTLNALNDWDDHTKLYEYGFANTVSKCFDDSAFVSQIKTNSRNVSEIPVRGISSFCASFKKGDESRVQRKIELASALNTPIEKGQIVGKVIYLLDDKIIGQNNVISDAEITDYPTTPKNIWQSVCDFFKRIFI